MGVRFQRHLGVVQTLDPGQFTVRTASGRPVFSCVLCGTIQDLPNTHRIDETGRVVPAVKCGDVTCSFFDYCDFASIHEEVL